jgi:dTDP-4-dehydrorhamnose 3,5-epimerase
MTSEDFLGARADSQTVTPAGRRIQKLIAGVEVRPAITHTDDRGEICELFDLRWGVLPEPVESVYWAMVRPRMTKGWIVHANQEDRMCVVSGFLKIVLYDARSGSATPGRVNEFFFSERGRGLLTIPRGVFHAVQNVGQVDACFVNMPTRPYDHENPDKQRLPLDTDRIPYSLAPRAGG